MQRITLAFLLFGFCAAAPAAWAEPCALNEVASLDMSIDGDGHAAVPVSIAGSPFTLAVDTGSFSSMLSASAVNALGLHPDYFDNVEVHMYGGARISQFVVVTDLVIGRLRASRVKLLVLPDSEVSNGMQGLLAADILRGYDDDFDFANAKLNLFEQSRCDGNLVYWTDDPAAEIPFKVDDVGHIEFTLSLDGKDIRATLDTGAADTVLDLETAERLFGLDEKDPNLVVHHPGTDDRYYTYPFKTLTFGGVAVANPRLVLIPRGSHVYDGPEMLLGMGVLRRLHMYISYRQRKLVVTAAAAH